MISKSTKKLLCVLTVEDSPFENQSQIRFLKYLFLDKTDKMSLRDRLKVLTVEELKIDLKKFKARLTGIKEELVDRLANYIEREQADVLGNRDPSSGKNCL